MPSVNGVGEECPTSVAVIRAVALRFYFIRCLLCFCLVTTLYEFHWQTIKTFVVFSVHVMHNLLHAFYFTVICYRDFLLLGCVSDAETCTHSSSENCQSTMSVYGMDIVIRTSVLSNLLEIRFPSFYCQ